MNTNKKTFQKPTIIFLTYPAALNWLSGNQTSTGFPAGVQDWSTQQPFIREDHLHHPRRADILILLPVCVSLSPSLL
jgi:hypothetical protein